MHKQATLAALGIALLAGLVAAVPAQAMHNKLPHPDHPACCPDTSYRKKLAKSLMTDEQKQAFISAMHHGHDAGTPYKPGTTVSYADGFLLYMYAKASPPVPSPRNVDEWCRWGRTWVWTANFANDIIWRYTMRVDWCWDAMTNTVIGSPSQPQVSTKIYAWAAADGWNYSGQAEPPQQWDYYHDGTVWRNRTVGTFNFCPPRIWCFQTREAWTVIDTFGDGTFDYYGGY